MEELIKDLLERWSNLEPQICYEDRVDFGWYYVGTGIYRCLIFANNKFEESNYINDIQGVVQRLIELKGWHYEQRWWGEKKIAYIYPSEIKNLIREDCTTHAEALLRAYLQALELTKSS